MEFWLINDKVEVYKPRTLVVEIVVRHSTRKVKCNLATGYVGMFKAGDGRIPATQPSIWSGLKWSTHLPAKQYLLSIG